MVNAALVQSTIGRTEIAPVLSVVVASVEAQATLGACLEALAVALRGLDAEVLLCHPADESLPTVDADARIRVVPVHGRALVPDLWGAGLAAARGAAVAFTTAHFRVEPTWARSLLGALEGGSSGAGGAIGLVEDATLLDRAIHLLRYSPYQPPVEKREVREIAGDNAAYRRSALEAYPEAVRDGFWEVVLHDRLRERDGHGGLTMAPGAEARYGRGPGLLPMMRQRWLHGRQFGAFRVSRGQSRTLVVLRAPGVPAIMTLRLLRRQRRRGRLLRALPALPFLLLLLSAWAIGEAWGAMTAGGSASASKEGGESPRPRGAT